MFLIIDDIVVSSYMHLPPTKNSMLPHLTSLPGNVSLQFANRCGPMAVKHVAYKDGGGITRANSPDYMYLPVQRGQP